MTRFRLVLTLIASSLFAALAAGFLAALMIVVVTEGPGALLGGLLLGFMGAGYAVEVAAVPALLLGSLLWFLRLRHAAIWAAVGSLAGLGCSQLARILPVGFDDAAAIVLDRVPVAFLPICMIAGAIAALLFRVLMRAFTAYEDAQSRG